MNKKFIVYFCTLILLSCNSKSNMEEVLNLEKIESISATLLITKIIPLATNQSNLLGSYLNVKYNREYIWILDKDNLDAIHGFNWQGESIGYVAERGEAPGQLFYLLDFILQGDQIIALSNLGDEINIYKYGIDNTLLSKAQYPFNCFTFWKNDKNGYWLYSGYNKIAGDFRLLSIDSSGKVLNKFLTNNFNENMISFSESSFFEGDGETLFKESFKPAVYQMTKNGPDLKYKFSFGKLEVPDSFWKMETISGFEMIDRNGFANIEFVAENSHYAIFDIFIQKEGELWKEIILLNKNTQESGKIIVDPDSNGHLLTPIGLEDDNILFISYAPYLVRNKANLNLSKEVLLTIDSIMEEDNPVIIYAKIPSL